MACDIKVNNNGPILVTGEFRLQDAEGQEFGLGGRTTIALCRCGESENKPFCDGAHARVGFASQIACRNLEPKNKK